MRHLISIFILVLTVVVSARGQALRNINGFGTNISFRGNVNVIDGIGVGDSIQVTNIGPTLGLKFNSGANPFTSDIYIGQGGVISFKFTGNGAGLTNLVGATNFTSTVTYNFNGKTTFNSVSYNTNLWNGPTNTFVLTTNYQDFVASTDCAITAVGGQLAGQNTWGTLTVSNSTAAPITVRVTASGVRAQGPNTTTALAIGAGKEGMLTFLSRDFKSTNFVTSAQSN